MKRKGLVITMLLCASMMFTACSQGESKDTANTATESTSTEATERLPTVGFRRSRIPARICPIPILLTWPTV